MFDAEHIIRQQLALLNLFALRSGCHTLTFAKGSLSHEESNLGSEPKLMQSYLVRSEWISAPGLLKRAACICSSIL